LTPATTVPPVLVRVQSSTLAPNARSSFDESASIDWLRAASGPPLWVVIGDASGSWRRTPSRAEPGRAPLVRVRSGAYSRAEAKGGGAPTGMSAMAAVAGKPIYTPPSICRKRRNSVPVPFRADSPRINAGADYHWPEDDAGDLSETPQERFRNASGPNCRHGHDHGTVAGTVEERHAEDAGGVDTISSAAGHSPDTRSNAAVSGSALRLEACATRRTQRDLDPVPRG